MIVVLYIGGADINYINKSGYTLLVSSLSSSMGSKVEKVKAILKLKADPNIKTPRGTALQQVLEWKGCTPNVFKEMVRPGLVNQSFSLVNNKKSF
jgi:hypothetical protein